MKGPVTYYLDTKKCQHIFYMERCDLPKSHKTAKKEPEFSGDTAITDTTGASLPTDLIIADRVHHHHGEGAEHATYLKLVSGVHVIRGTRVYGKPPT